LVWVSSWIGGGGRGLDRSKIDRRAARYLNQFVGVGWDRSARDFFTEVLGLGVIVGP
jgi:hypothetical protein